MPPLRLGEEAGEFTDVASADQVVHGGVVTWRQRPVVAGRGATPDPPPRVAAPELVKFGIPGIPAAAGVHARCRLITGRAGLAGRQLVAASRDGAAGGPPG
jgi:hypothetical protein